MLNKKKKEKDKRRGKRRRRTPAGCTSLLILNVLETRRQNSAPRPVDYPEKQKIAEANVFNNRQASFFTRTESQGNTGTNSKHKMARIKRNRNARSHREISEWLFQRAKERNELRSCLPLCDKYSERRLHSNFNLRFDSRFSFYLLC